MHQCFNRNCSTGAGFASFHLATAWDFRGRIGLCARQRQSGRLPRLRVRASPRTNWTPCGMSYGNGQQRPFLLSGTTGSFTNVMQKDLTGGCLITWRRSQDSRWRPVIDHRPSPRWTRATRRHLAKKFVPPGRCSPQERDLSKATQFSRAGAQ